MSKTITVTLSDAEFKALEVVAISAQEWVDNAVHNRCRIAIEEIVTAEVERITETGGAISGTKEDIVLAAPIKSAAERHAEAEALLNAGE
jgi:aspartyl aminopeptidase